MVFSNNFRRTWLAGLVVSLACGTISGQTPDATAILEKVDAATRAVVEISYKSECWGEGSMKDQPRVGGMVRAKAEGTKSLDGWIPKLSLELPGRGYQLITDGKDGLLLMNKQKSYKRAAFDTFEQQIRESINTIYMQEYMHPKPFSDELNGEKRKYEGTKSIHGVECDVIYVVYSGGQGEARWYFGQKDHLPRRVDRIIKQGGQDGARVTELSELNAKPAFDDATFALTPPAGFQDDSPGILPAGRKAPEFTLNSPDGKSVSLASLKGKVVVLDFWATWCPPCKKAMPSIQRLHEAFAGKPVVVIGMNCWEKPEASDPAAFLKEGGYTYTPLLKADATAELYKVKSIPAFFVIDAEGVIAHSASGFEAGTEEALRKAVEAAVAKISK